MFSGGLERNQWHGFRNDSTGVSTEAPIYVTGFFLGPLKTSENLCFYVAF